MEATHQRHGDFAWQELQSADPAKARAFYEGLLGWTTTTYPMPFGDYLVFSAGDAQLGGAMARGEDGCPAFTSWLPYVLVDDVDAAAEKAVRLGGAVLEAAHDIPGVGRAATVAGPEGAALAIVRWTEATSRVLPGPGRFCWRELVSDDPATSIAFYGGLFGWGSGEMDMGPHGTYHLWRQDGSDHGGMMKRTAEWGEIPCHWMLYVLVDDVDERAAAVPELGGRVCVPPTDIPGVGRFCVVDDGAGGTLSLLTPAQG